MRKWNLTEVSWVPPYFHKVDDWKDFASPPGNNGAATKVWCKNGATHLDKFCKQKDRSFENVSVVRACLKTWLTMKNSGEK